MAKSFVSPDGRWAFKNWEDSGFLCISKLTIPGNLLPKSFFLNWQFQGASCENPVCKAGCHRKNGFCRWTIETQLRLGTESKTCFLLWNTANNSGCKIWNVWCCQRNSFLRQKLVCTKLICNETRSPGECRCRSGFSGPGCQVKWHIYNIYYISYNIVWYISYILYII